jgi:hypothetical protein
MRSNLTDIRLARLLRGPSPVERAAKLRTEVTPIVRSLREACRPGGARIASYFAAHECRALAAHLHELADLIALAFDHERPNQ